MKTSKLFSTFLAIVFSLVMICPQVLADVAIPTAKSVSIKLKQNHPDYDFYYCEVPVSFIYRQGRRYTNHYDDTQIKSIELEVDTPFIVPKTILEEDLYKDSYFGKKYIFAVKKGTSNDIKKLKGEFVTAIKKAKGKRGIYFFEINDTEQSGDFDNRRNLTYTIESIDGSELKTDRKFDNSEENVNQSSSVLSESENDNFQIKTSISYETPNQSSAPKYIGAGFGLAGLIFVLGILFLRKSNKNL